MQNMYLCFIGGQDLHSASETQDEHVPADDGGSLSGEMVIFPAKIHFWVLIFMLRFTALFLSYVSFSNIF